MSSLGDIQLNIIVNVQGLAAAANLSGVVAGVGASQAKIAGGMTAATKAASSQAAQMQTLRQRLTDVEQKYDAVFRASYRLQIVGYQLIGAGQKILEYVKSLTDEWGKFEFTINRAAGALQVWKNTATGVNPVYGALIDNVLSLTKELRIFPAEDVAKATYFWASTSGQAVKTMGDLKSVMASVNPIMKIAALTQTSYETAIKGVYSIIVQYGKGLGDVADVTAKLQLVTQRTALEFPDLINSFKYLGPVAASMGVTFEEVAKTLGQIGDAGIRGSQAGRALRQMFIQTLRPAAKAKAAMDALFLSTEGINQTFQNTVFPEGKYIGMTAFVHKLAVALQNATVAEKGRLLATISTANELPVLTALVANEIKVIKGLPGAYDTAKASVDDAAYAASQFQRSWELLANSWKGITGRITAGIQVIKIRVGKELADALTPAIMRFTELLDKVELWVKRNPDVVRSLGKMAGFAGAFAAIAGSVLVATGSILGLGSALVIIATGFGKMIAPASAVAGILATVAQVIFENLTRIRRVLGPAFHDMLEAFGVTKLGVDDFKSAMQAIKQPIHDIVDAAVRGLIPILKTVFDILGKIAQSPAKGILEAIGKTLITVFTLRIISNVIGLTKVLGLLWVGIKRLDIIIWAWRAGLLAVSAPITGIMAAVIALTGIMAAFIVMTSKAAHPIFALIAVVTTLAIALHLVGVEGAIAGVTGAVAALKNGFMALGKAGPLLLLTGIAMAASALYDINFLGIRDALRDVSGEIAETREHIKDLVYDMGRYGPALDAAVKSMVDPKYRGELSELGQQLGYYDQALRSATGSAKMHLEAQRSMVQHQYDLVLAAQEKEHADELEKFGQVARDNFTSVEAVAKLANEAMRLFGVQSEATARTYADTILKVMGDETQMTVEDAVKAWNQLGEQGIQLNITPEAFIKTKVSEEVWNKFVNDFTAQADIAKARIAVQMGNWDVAYPILAGLKANSAEYSDKINTEISGLMAKVPQGLSEILQKTEEIASQGPKAIFTAITDAITDLGDIQTRFEEALKGGITPAKFANLFLGNITGPQVTEAFKSPLINMNSFALAEINSARQDLYAAIAATADNPEQRQQLSQTLVDNFNKAFKAGFADPKFLALEPEQQAAITEAVNWAFGQIGLTAPTPAVVTATSKQVTANVSRLVTEEMNLSDPTTATPYSAGKDALAFAVAGMKISWDGPSGGKVFIRDSMDYAKTMTNQNLMPGGYNTFQSYRAGILASWYGPNGGKAVVDSIALYVANHLIGLSPPKEGPLHLIDKGGYNIMAAWGGGLEAGGRVALSKAVAAAQGINTALAAVNGGLGSGGALDISSDAKRHLVVEFEISSPDGSVAAMQQADFERALKTTGVMRNIEHMAAVRG